MYEAFLNQWRVLLAGQTPKGDATLDKLSKAPKAAQDKNDKEIKPDDVAKSPPETPSKSSSDPNKPPPDWNFGMFGPNPSGGPKSGNQGQGRPIGGEQPPDQTRMLLFGALGFIAFVGALTFFEMGYKEISWKDFVNK